MSAGLTRRAALSGAVASVAVVGVAAAAAMPVIVTGDRTDWNAAVANQRAARAAFELAIEDCSDVPLSDPAYPSALAEEERTSALDTAAMNRLMTTPAPDLEAVSFKVTLARDYELAFDGVLADLHRFAKREG